MYELGGFLAWADSSLRVAPSKCCPLALAYYADYSYFPIKSNKCIGLGAGRQRGKQTGITSRPRHHYIMMAAVVAVGAVQTKQSRMTQS